MLLPYNEGRKKGLSYKREEKFSGNAFSQEKSCSIAYRYW